MHMFPILVIVIIHMPSRLREPHFTLLQTVSMSISCKLSSYKLHSYLYLANCTHSSCELSSCKSSSSKLASCKFSSCKLYPFFLQTVILQIVFSLFNAGPWSTILLLVEWRWIWRASLGLGLILTEFLLRRWVKHSFFPLSSLACS